MSYQTNGYTINGLRGFATSSKGGRLDLDAVGSTSFPSAEWTGIKWFALNIQEGQRPDWCWDRDACEEWIGVDNIRIEKPATMPQVPIPSALVVLMPALVGFGVGGWRQLAAREE